MTFLIIAFCFHGTCILQTELFRCNAKRFTKQDNKNEAAEGKTPVPNPFVLNHVYNKLKIRRTTSAANVLDLDVISVRITVGSLLGNPHLLVMYIIANLLRVSLPKTNVFPMAKAGN